MSISDHIRLTHRAWKYRLRQDRAEIRLVRSRLTSGDVAIDVGAHKGAYTFWMRKAVGPAGCVYAFEPQPRLASALAAMISTRRWNNVILQQAAVADEPGRMELIIPGGGDSPAAHLESPRERRGSQPDSTDTRIEVDVITLDEVLADEQRPIRFIKCDVEGFELDVFRGAEQVLRSHGPALLFECERRHQQEGRSIGETFTYLQTLGLRGWFLDGDALQPIERFNPEKHQRMAGDRYWDEPGYCNNFLFEPAG